ncbi:DUF1330 domain-containing protein [Hirschia maritima]|uniref:DUF1330 domain-containing protein n=1 Tax=Hirschia maritima TaxID=1121961 RepID=UPI0003672518|nr:DUF1330 domain-containing protein [Hirschia maritima]
MPAYMIILCKIHEREKFISGYGQAVPKLVQKFGGEYLIVAPGAELLEGQLGGYASVAISKWRNKNAAKKFWDSPEYAEAKKLREGLADAEVVLVETP